MFFHIDGVQDKAADDFTFAVARAAQHEIFTVLTGFWFFKYNRLHHLPHHAIGENHDRCAVFISHIKSVHRQICQFLASGRAENYRAVIAVSAAAGGLKIISL